MDKIINRPQIFVALIMVLSCTTLSVFAHQVKKEKASFKANVHSPAVMNAKFKDPNLDVQHFINKFEADDREVFLARKEITKRLGINDGESVADVGAGTGIFLNLFSDAVGKKGWLYAIDISPNFLAHINKMSKASSTENVSCILSTEDSVCLPPKSVDLAFVCNTYHHFSKPEKMLKTIKQALKPNGRLAIIDFDRVPGKSREWIINHIHKDSKSVQKELESAGFQLIESIKLKALEENYFLIFSLNEEK